MLISRIGICRTLDSFAIDCPASSAVMSKATDICAAVSANDVSSSFGTPNCPPAATICASPSKVRGIVSDSFFISDSICRSSSGLSKSMTFFTSAIADSNATAGLTSPYKLAPSDTTSIIWLRYDARCARLACCLLCIAAMADCLERNVSSALPSALCSLFRFLVSTPACFRLADNSRRLLRFCWYAVLASNASFLAVLKLLFSCFEGLSVWLIAVASFLTSLSAFCHC